MIHLVAVTIDTRDEQVKTATRKNPIKICVLTASYKLKIIKFKLDGDPLKRRINDFNPCKVTRNDMLPVERNL